MIRQNNTSLKYIKSENNLLKGREYSIGSIKTNNVLRIEKQNNPTARTLFVQRSNSDKRIVLVEKNQKIRNERDIDMIEKYKKELERSFGELKRLEEEVKKYMKVIKRLSVRIEELEYENREVKKEKEMVRVELEERIKGLMGGEGKRNRLDIVVIGGERQVKSQRVDMEGLNVMIRGGNQKQTSSKDLAHNSVTTNTKQDYKNLQQKLKSTQMSLNFYKQRQQQREEHIRQLQDEIQKYHSNNKNSFDTYQNTLMMMYAQASSLQALIK